METINIEIVVNNNYPSFDFSPNTPCIIADKIKQIVRNYYEEIQNKTGAVQ